MKSCRGALIQGLKISYLKREQRRLWKCRQKEQELRRQQITRWTGAETEAAIVVSHNTVKTRGKTRGEMEWFSLWWGEPLYMHAITMSCWSKEVPQAFLKCSLLLQNESGAQVRKLLHTCSQPVHRSASSSRLWWCQCVSINTMQGKHVEDHATQLDAI